MKVYIIRTIHGLELFTCSESASIAQKKWDEYVENWAENIKKATEARVIVFKEVHNGD